MRSTSVTMIWLGFGSTISLTLNSQHSASHSTKKPMMKSGGRESAAQLRVHHAASLAGAGRDDAVRAAAGSARRSPA